MSEAMLAMVLDVEVARHKRELTEAFSAARKRLIPPPKPNALEALYNAAMMNAANNPMRYYNHIAAAQNPFCNQGVFYNQGGTLGIGGSILGIGTPWF